MPPLPPHPQAAALCPTVMASQRTALSLLAPSLCSSSPSWPAWPLFLPGTQLNSNGFRPWVTGSSHSALLGQAGRQPLCSLTHCTLPSLQGRGACFVRQQTYQGFCGCQALAGAPTQPSSHSLWWPHSGLRGLAERIHHPPYSSVSSSLCGRPSSLPQDICTC